MLSRKQGWHDLKGMDGTRLRILTHKSDILKQVGVDPNRPLHRDDRQAPKDQPDNRERDEQAHETRDTDREVPDTNPELDGPEGGHDAREHDDYHRCAS